MVICTTLASSDPAGGAEPAGGRPSGRDSPTAERNQDPGGTGRRHGPDPGRLAAARQMTSARRPIATRRLASGSTRRLPNGCRSSPWPGIATVIEHPDTHTPEREAAGQSGARADLHRGDAAASLSRTTPTSSARSRNSPSYTTDPRPDERRRPAEVVRHRLGRGSVACCAARRVAVSALATRAQQADQSTAPSGAPSRGGRDRVSAVPNARRRPPGRQMGAGNAVCRSWSDVAAVQARSRGSSRAGGREALPSWTGSNADAAQGALGPGRVELEKVSISRH